MVYVDGEIRGKWITEDCEIRRKFFQKHRRSLLTRKAVSYTHLKLANASYNISIPIQQGIKSLMIIVPQSKAKVNEKEEKI